MSTPFSVRLSDDDAKALEKLAAATDRSKSYLVQKAVESYLAEYEDYRVALDRLRDGKDEVVSSAALQRRLGSTKQRPRPRRR